MTSKNNKKRLLELFQTLLLHEMDKNEINIGSTSSNAKQWNQNTSVIMFDLLNGEFDLHLYFFHVKAKFVLEFNQWRADNYQRQKFEFSAEEELLIPEQLRDAMKNCAKKGIYCTLYHGCKLTE